MGGPLLTADSAGSVVAQIATREAGNRLALIDPNPQVPSLQRGALAVVLDQQMRR